MTEIDKFRRELAVRKYAYSTIQTYAYQLEFLIANFGLKPDIEQLKDYLITIKSQAHHKQIVAVTRNYYDSFTVSNWIYPICHTLASQLNCK